MRYVQGKIDRQQLSIFPIAFDDLINEDNTVRIIEAFVEILDIKSLGFKHSETKATKTRQGDRDLSGIKKIQSLGGW